MENGKWMMEDGAFQLGFFNDMILKSDHPINPIP